MIATDQIVFSLSVDVADTVEMRIIPMIDFAKDTPIGWSLVSYDAHEPLQCDAFNRCVKKRFGGFCISPSCELEFYHLAVCVDCSPQVPPLANDADIGCVHVPIDADTAQVFLSALGQLGTEPLNLSKHGQSIHFDTAFSQQIHYILAGQRKS